MGEKPIGSRGGGQVIAPSGGFVGDCELEYALKGTTARLEEAIVLLEAVKDSYLNFYCEDVKGVNWFDAREAFLAKAKGADHA